jgi:pimeloyl-ACP methyl ester carboxylesterase
VLLAPAPRSARVYRRLLPLLSGFRALAVDTRGFGESDPPDGNMTMSDYAHDVVTVLDALAIEQAHVFGLHTGNKIAAAMAAGWPDRVDRVVLAGRTHSIVADQSVRNAAIRASMAPGPERGADDRSGLLQRWARAFTKVSQIWSSAETWGPSPDDESLVILRDEVMDEIAAWSGVDSVYAANFEFDLAESLKRVKAPTLVIELVTSETEALGPQASLLQALMSRCETMAIDGHERALLVDHPERLAGAVVAFLKAGSAATPEAH